MNTLTFAAYNAYLAIVEAAVPDFVVHDGPQPQIPTDQKMILLGVADPIGGGPQRSIDLGVQEWESLGAQSRMETFTINSSLVVWSGDSGFAALRDIAQDALDAIGAALRSPPHGTGDAMLGNVLNQGGQGTGWCGFAVGGMDQVQVPAGPAVHVQFALACTARI